MCILQEHEMYRFNGASQNAKKLIISVTVWNTAMYHSSIFFYTAACFSMILYYQYYHILFIWL